MTKTSKELPTYVFISLNRYGNTIITKKDVKRLGGEEAVLKLLKKKGFNCTLTEPAEQVVYMDRKRVVTLDHLIVREIRK